MAGAIVAPDEFDGAVEVGRAGADVAEGAVVGAVLGSRVGARSDMTTVGGLEITCGAHATISSSAQARRIHFKLDMMALFPDSEPNLLFEHLPE